MTDPGESYLEARHRLTQARRRLLAVSRERARLLDENRRQLARERERLLANAEAELRDRLHEARQALHSDQQDAARELAVLSQRRDEAVQLAENQFEESARRVSARGRARLRGLRRLSVLLVVVGIATLFGLQAALHSWPQAALSALLLAAAPWLLWRHLVPAWVTRRAAGRRRRERAAAERQYQAESDACERVWAETLAKRQARVVDLEEKLRQVRGL